MMNTAPYFNAHEISPWTKRMYMLVPLYMYMLVSVYMHVHVGIIVHVHVEGVCDSDEEDKGNCLGVNLYYM